MADLGDYYPQSQPPPQTVSGTQPVTPGVPGVGMIGKGIGAPAVWTLVFVGGALALMHWE